MNNVEKIMAGLSVPERLTQLAEECAELGHAALKLRRALNGTNPTPVTIKEANEAFNEEVADVLLCMAVTSSQVRSNGLVLEPMLRAKMETKAARWVKRLEGRNEGTPAAAGTSSDPATGRDTFPKGEGWGDGPERGHIDPELDQDGEDGETVNTEMIMEAKRELVRTVIEGIAALLSI